MFKKLRNNLLESVEINSWLVHIVKSIQVLVVFPIIYKYLSSEAAALWMIFTLFVSLQNLFDLGFQNVFVRILSQASTGSWSLLKGKQVVGEVCDQVKDKLLLRIDSTIRFVYSVLTIFFLLLVVSIGTLYIYQREIQLSVDDFSIYFWYLFVIGLITSFYNRRYTSYLIGVKCLALVKRLESIVNFFSLIIGLGAFLIYPYLLTLIINYTLWQLILGISFRNSYEKRKVVEKHKLYLDKEVFKFVWPMAWKGTISSLSSYGLVSLFSLWFGSYANAKEIISFTYSLKILDSTRLFSRVPFYSNIPNLNAKRISKSYDVFFNNALKNVLRSNLIFLVLVLGFYFVGFDLLELLSKSFKKVDDLVWILLCLAYYLQLNGAFHTHIYSMTNRVNSQISDLVSGILILIFLFLFFDKTSLFLFPIALIIGYGGFYLPWALFYSNKVLKKGFLQFILRATLVPFLVSLLFLLKF